MLMALVMSPRSVGATILLALCSFTSVSRADLVVFNNTGSGPSDLTFPTVGDSGTTAGYIGQVFTTGSGGTLTSLALQLDITAGASASVYITPNAFDSATFTLLGTVASATTQAHQNISVDFGANPLFSLNASTTYAIVLESSSANMAWDYTSSTASGGDGTAGGTLESTDGGTTWSTFVSGDQMQMDLIAAVPEVPVTGAVMGFGALAIAAGCTLRRKLCPSVSSVV